MKKLLCTVMVLFNLFCISLTYGASISIHKTTDNSMTGALSNDGNIWDGIMAAGHYSNPRTYRGFAEFDLQSIYALNLSSADIISVVFKTDVVQAYDYLNVGDFETIDFYGLNDNNDGVLGSYDADVSLIQGEMPLSSYIDGFEVDVTVFFKSDMDTTELFTGYSMRLTNESVGELQTTYVVAIFGDQWLEITYNTPDAPSVPEPLSAVLIGLGLAGRFLFPKK